MKIRLTISTTFARTGVLQYMRIVVSTLSIICIFAKDCQVGKNGGFDKKDDHAGDYQVMKKLGNAKSHATAPARRIKQPA